MLASAPSARCACPRITPGCSTKVRFTRSSNSRIRHICVNIQIRRSLESWLEFGIADSSAYDFLGCRYGVSRFADISERSADVHFRGLAHQYLEQHAVNRRVQLVAHLLRFQLDDRFSLLERVALVLDPADDSDFRRVHSARLGNHKIRYDGEFLPRSQCQRPEVSSNGFPLVRHPRLAGCRLSRADVPTATVFLTQSQCD